jgi:hypothetical protein
MKTIPLTRGKEALVDDEDYEFLMQWKWHYRKDARTGYASRWVRSQRKQYVVWMHHTVCQRAGITLDGKQCDHRDQNGLNNRRSNLRPATQIENNRNQRRRQDNTSGVKGVDWYARSQKWRVRVAGECIGYFQLLEHAHQARDQAAKKVFGTFAPE